MVFCVPQTTFSPRRFLRSDRHKSHYCRLEFSFDKEQLDWLRLITRFYLPTNQPTEARPFGNEHHYLTFKGSFKLNFFQREKEKSHFYRRNGILRPLREKFSEKILCLLLVRSSLSMEGIFLKARKPIFPFSTSIVLKKPRGEKFAPSHDERTNFVACCWRRRRLIVTRLKSQT